MPARLVVRLAIVLLSLLVATPARAQTLTLIGLSELSNAGTRCQTIITNNMAEAIEGKRLDSFMRQLADLRGAMKSYQARIDEAEKNADAVAASLVGMHDEKDPAKWEPERRKVYEEALEQKRQAVAARAAFRGLSADVRTIGSHRTLRNSKTFAANSRWYRDRLRAMAERLQSMGGGGPVGPPPGPGPVGPPIAAGGPALRLENQSKDVWFMVNGSWLKSGEKVKLAAAQLEVRALAMTPIRDLIMNKGETPHATIHEQSPYAFRFTVDAGGGAGETTRLVKREEYTWNVLGPEGAPKVDVSTTKRSNDTVRFAPPLLRRAMGQAIRAYSFNVRGELEWSYERTGAMGNVKKTENERFGGTLVVYVDPI